MDWCPLFAASLVVTASSVFAESAKPFPERPVHLVVGLPAGGGADAIARIIATGLGDAIGQPVVVENRPGANGVIAAESVARAAPDGHVLYFGGVTAAAMLPILGMELSFDPMRDLTPVSLLAAVPTVLVVGSAMPVKTLDDLLSFAKARGDVNYASSGNGGQLHLSMEMLKARTGMRATHIPYKGGVQALPDLLSGQIHAMFEILPTDLANIKAGKVRALAIASERRHPQIPDVPTMSEAGVPGFDSTIWYAVFAPSRTPPAIVGELNHRIGTLLRSARIRERLEQLGGVATPSTQQEALQLRKTEIEKWTAVIQRADIHLDK
jgi:tripartite-type tricarboxylate transporter receptor subunit TctC